MYIPLYSTSLNFIFGSAELILPAEYAALRGNRMPDIQNIYPRHILLSKKKWVKECEINAFGKEIVECEVSIEVNLSKDDKKRLKKLDDNFYLYDMPIQLSKIKTVWFLDSFLMIRATNLIEMSQGFFPKNITKVDENPKPIEFKKPKTRVPKLKDISKKVTLFRKYLGGLILARNLLRKKDFFQYLETTLSETDINLRKIILNRMVQKEDVEKIAKKENIKLEYFVGIIERKKVPVNSLTYLFVMLFAYRPFMGSKLTGFIKDVSEDVSKETLEKYILLYGVMSNYNELDFYSIIDNKKIYHRFDYKNKEEDFKIVDRVFETVFREKISRKERLLEIEKMDLEQINIFELAQKYQVSEQTIRKDIREVFKIGKMRIEKYIKLKKLKQLLKDGQLSTQDISEKLAISKNTTRKYLKELEAEKIYSGKTPLYSLNLKLSKVEF